MTLRRIASAILVVAAFFIALGFALDFLVDWLWLSTGRYVDVFLTIFAAKAGLFFVVFAALAIVLSLNGALAHRLPRAGKAHRAPLFPGKGGRHWPCSPRPSLALSHCGRRARPHQPHCARRERLVGHRPLLGGWIRCDRRRERLDQGPLGRVLVGGAPQSRDGMFSARSGRLSTLQRHDTSSAVAAFAGAKERGGVQEV
jgi:hypothetical protein